MHDPMRNKQAKDILNELFQGINPKTKEELPEDSVVNQIEVHRAIHMGMLSIELVQARAARRALLPPGVGRAWTGEEENRLREAFSKKVAIAEIATKHGRTVRAIEARLEKIGLLEPSQRSTSNRFLTPQAKPDDKK